MEEPLKVIAIALEECNFLDDNLIINLSTILAAPIMDVPREELRKAPYNQIIINEDTK